MTRAFSEAKQTFLEKGRLEIRRRKSEIEAFENSILFFVVVKGPLLEGS